MSLPSTPRYARALPWIAVLAAAWLALFPITSVDAYYHLATGRRILDERTIPERGVGSATFGNAPWHDNEWGFQVLAAAVGRAERDPFGVLVLTPGGRAGLIVMRAVFCGLALAAVAATMQGLAVPAGIAALGVWLTAFLTFGNLFWDIRPQIVSYLALAVVAACLEAHRRGRRGALPAAVVTVALWANLHGAFVLGCGLIALEAAGAAIEWWRERGGGVDPRPLAAAALAAPLAACLNPLGWRQVVHPFLYLARPEIYARNNEWTRPDLLHLPLLVVAAALVAACILAGARLRPGHILRLAAFGVLFLSAIRHLPFLAIVAAPVGAAAVADTARTPWGARWRARLGGPVRSGLAVAVVAVAIVGLSGAKFVRPWPSFDERPSRPLPEAQVRYLARHGPLSAGFNDYRFGGFLMFRLYPGEVAVMDGRNDLYGTFRRDVYLPILDAVPGWERAWSSFVARYGVRWALLDASAPLAAGLAGTSEWRRVPDQVLRDETGYEPGAFDLFVAP